MNNFCNGICQRFHAKKPTGIGRYTSGQKRCNECDIFINWDGQRCPCCNYKLRLKPRNRKYKIKYLDNKNSNLEVLLNGM